VRKLLEAGFAVRAISRSADPFGGERMPAHARVIAADLYDEASLVPAFDGAEAVFHNHPMRVRRVRRPVDRRVSLEQLHERLIIGPDDLLHPAMEGLSAALVSTE
jgi:uncharacterized protein YbjT (DUF2867 family)